MKPKEKTHMGQQVIEFSPSSKEGTLTNPRTSPVLYESNSKREEDLAVSGTIIPLMARVYIVMPSPSQCY